MMLVRVNVLVFVLLPSLCCAFIPVYRPVKSRETTPNRFTDRSSISRPERSPACPPGPVGLQGPTGEKGVPGYPGLRGSFGYPGYPGIKGDLGPKGEQGALGAMGPPGVSLPWKKGITVVKGRPGSPGKDGAPGLPGKDGFPGSRGPPGPNGEKGAKGDGGLPGVYGSYGDFGMPGDKGYPGRRGDPGVPGKNGAPGPRGLLGKGREGVPGIKGEHGEPGLDGLRGIKGEHGYPAKDGVPGVPGKDGAPGAQGIAGPPGLIPSLKCIQVQTSGNNAICPAGYHVTGCACGMNCGSWIIQKDFTQCSCYLSCFSLLDCDNFTLYNTPGCGPYCWKTIWLYCSIISSFLMLFSLCKRFVPEIRPERNTTVLRILLKKPYFWSLSFGLFLVVVYDVLIIVQNENAREHIEIIVIISKVFTLTLVFQLNFTLPPTVARGFKVITVTSYYSALSMFALDNLCKTITTSAQVAFKIYTIDKATAAKPITIINLMLMVCNAALYNSFLQFFWHKMFRGQKDILTIHREDLSENIEEILEEEAGPE